MRRIVTLVSVVALCAPLSASGDASPSGTPWAKALHRSILAAALAQSSAHYSYSEYNEGEWPSRWVGDVTADSGSQQLSVTVPGVRETVDFLLVNDVVYARGDVGGLMYGLNLTEAQATAYAGQWISIPKSDSFYGQAAADLTLSSSVEDFIPDTQMSVHTCSGLVHCGLGWWNPRHKPGPFLALDGSASQGAFGGAMELTATTSRKGARLPIDFQADFGEGGASGSFSKWNEPVDVQAPESATPIATVRSVRTPRPSVRVAADLPPRSRTWPPYPHFSSRSCWGQGGRSGLMRWAPSFAPANPRFNTSPQQIAQRVLARFGDHRFIHGIHIGSPPRRFSGRGSRFRGLLCGLISMRPGRTS